MSTSGDDNAPTLEQELAAFRGSSTTEGVTTSVQTGDAPADDDGGEAARGQQQANGAQQSGGKRASAQDRIDKAVKAQRTAERALDEFKGRYTSLEERMLRIEQGGLTKPTVTKNVDPNAPDPTKFQFGEMDAGYTAALARYEATKVIEAERAARTQKAQFDADAALRSRVADFVAKGAEKYPDFQEAVHDDDSLPLTKTLAELALESDVGAEVLYSFATGDRKEAQRVSKLSEAQQARWFGIQEAKFSAQSAANGGEQGQQRQTSQRAIVPNPARTTQAPPPPSTRVRGGGSPQPTQPETDDFAAFEALTMRRQ